MLETSSKCILSRLLVVLLMHLLGDLQELEMNQVDMVLTKKQRRKEDEVTTDMYNLTVHLYGVQIGCWFDRASI